MRRVLKQKQIMLINAPSALVNLLESNGFGIASVQEDARRIKSAVWFVKPIIIFYYVERIDFDGFDPLSHIPRLFWPRTVIVSSALDEQDILSVLERHQKRQRRTRAKQKQYALFQ